MNGKRQPSKESARILRFERPSARARGHRHPVGIPDCRLPRSTVEDMGGYERAPEELDDFRHRRLMNAATLLICLLLVVTGVWIANKMAELRRDQDCVLAGRRNCAEITIIGNTAR